MTTHTRRSAVFFFLCLYIISCTQAQPSGRSNFDTGWKFNLGEISEAQQSSFDDSKWRSLDLPHDWSIEGEFNIKNPATNNGGSLPGGVGWYRKKFNVVTPLTGSKYFIEFDGVYMNSTVWVNGKLLGTRPYGYATFQYDITGSLKEGDNLVAVRVDNSKQPNSRWYSGSGIYRHVWLIQTPEIHFEQYGTYITTPVVNEKEAVVDARAMVTNETAKPVQLEVKVSIYAADGALVGEQKQAKELAPAASGTVEQNIKLSSPRLWDIELPYLYKVITGIYSDKKLLQSYITPLGIRFTRFDSDKGFFLNGKPLKILGVCNHHDLGCLGSAINDKALERQLRILKDMGCNAIRTSHNPPAPELLDLCDRMGFLVMDEAFDCWYIGKNKYDFHRYFRKWHETELSDMVQRDRNHPSVILWSIGNEIPEQGTANGGRVARELKRIVREYDTTRLVTSAMSDIRFANNNGYAAALDVVGINYDVNYYDKQKQKYQNRVYISSEATSAVASRGVYHMPADKLIYKSADLQCSAYDNCWVPWGNSAEEAWLEVKKRDFMSGLFVWTGFDYIGEPTPYNYPAVSSYFGIVDLCGFPKDPYYMYQSQWTAKPVLHLLPHWNWKTGDTIDVLAFTNCDEVKLFLNGQPVGTRTFAGTDKIHLSWRVPFQPGTLKAEGYSKGKLIKTDEVKTAGAPAKLLLVGESNSMKANGTDMDFITVKVTDANGILVPDADRLIHFEVDGAGKIAGVDNGKSISLEPHKADHRKAFNGMCLLVVQSKRSSGSIKIKAWSEGLEGKELELKVE